MNKDLKEKAINIKGKQYVQVADRILYFNENYLYPSIETSYELVDKMFIVKATVSYSEIDEVLEVPQPLTRLTFTGHSQAIIGDGMVNKTAALENAETSAVGRALAMMGIGVIESIASVDEINKATGSYGEPGRVTDYTPMTARVTVPQVTELLQAAKEHSGLGTKEAVLKWFEETIGMKVDQVKKIEFDAVLRKIVEERYV